MSALLDYQRGFVAALLSASAPPADRVEPLAIYRNNFLSNLEAALGAVYPVVRRLVGERFFGALARQFIAACASTSADIEQYGAGFAQFVERDARTRKLAYLPDVARLEWLYHQAFHAAHCSADAIAKVLGTQSQYGCLRFSLHPACRMLESAYPVAAIWRSNQPDRAADDLIELNDEKEYLLIRRPVFEVEIVSISHAEFVAFEHLARGEDLETAVDAANAIDPGFDIPRFLGLLFTPGGACGVIAGDG